MKTITYLLGICLMAFVIVNCKNSTNPEVKTIEVETASTKEKDPNATYAKAEFTVDGMTCAIGCAATIEKKIAKMEGVTYAKVDFDKRLAMVEYDEAKVNPTSLENTVTSVADIYKVSDMKTVDDFSGQKSEAKKTACKADCKKDCCKAEKKMACAADCKKECCAKKA
ncbi:heavy-metal-associated domain-containing protein [Hyunsoonleella sp. SJ7]|uniref:Heavy-metal-associated domain-containing protein n=1 Tax=Hyunsoonleella aquatilis TaxID=2762758 RepID=A0A923HH10_9FLAO|nr:heavy metal-associated domain-containing protein [Hyunsoonleella aquatilis]MBC3758237.1 heavy-metal-associated domain-containing protein [Hyunsoonleella aquatilis]